MAMNSAKPFHVSLTADFYDADGSLNYRDIGLELLTSQQGIAVDRFKSHSAEIEPEQLAGCNGAIVLSPRVTARSLSASQDLLAIVRFGVGFDSVDAAACSANDVALFITAGAVDYSVAEATVGWMLALNHHIQIKDSLVRTGQWQARSRYMGSELRDRTLGVIGFGGIGQSVVELLSSFRMKPPLVFDPFVSPDRVAAAGAVNASLDELLSQADFVSLHCPLNEHTRNLLGVRELSLMKPTAFLLNTARGGIVDEDALFAALSDRRIAGAAIDCFSNEPITAPPRWSALENVILAPHSIAWTNELFRDIGRCACQAMVDLSQRRWPNGLINKELLTRKSFQDKWHRLSKR
jgi:phosphoglycerate dehydrogenase-like enzyme